jgi:hypothetical protein
VISGPQLFYRLHVVESIGTKFSFGKYQKKESQMLRKGDRIEINDYPGHKVGQVVEIAAAAVGGAVVAIGKVVLIEGPKAIVRIITGQGDDAD